MHRLLPSFVNKLLAAFLAEITQSDSGIFLDDPVCSLDHNWREKIAARLLQEGKSRQVVIFTHDLAFASMIDDLAEGQKPDVGHRHIEKRGIQAGLVSEMGPWKAATTTKRSGVLKTRLQHLRKLYEQPGTQYDIEMRDFYGMLRESWERAIEECLFGSSICRYRKSVETKRLKKALLAVKPDDYETIEKAMGRCSAVLRGHYTALDLNPSQPTPEECQNDFEIFDTWSSERRRSVN